MSSGKPRCPLGASSPVITAAAHFPDGRRRKETRNALPRSIQRAGFCGGGPSLPHALETLHQLNNPASPTPVTDGKNVYVFFGDFGLVSYSVDGTERWRMPLGPFANLHGMAASPILAGGLAIHDLRSGQRILSAGNKQGFWKGGLENPAARSSSRLRDTFDFPLPARGRTKSLYRAPTN